jgi:translation initiation factor IF-3
MYRGREMVHRQLGYQQLDHVRELLGEFATVENPPRMEGRVLSMILVPNREAIAEAARLEAAKTAAEAEAAGGESDDGEAAEDKTQGLADSAESGVAEGES